VPENTTTTNPTYNLMPLHDYTLFDVSAGYSADKYCVRFKLSNMFGKLNLNVHHDDNVNPIAPGQISAALCISYNSFFVMKASRIFIQYLIDIVDLYVVNLYYRFE
jgi:hypothetical protein